MSGFEQGLFAIHHGRALEATLPPVSALIGDRGAKALESEVWEPRHRALLQADAFRSWVAADVLPIPNNGDREQYFAGRDIEYWLSGLADAQCVLHAAASLGMDLRSGRLLDLGGTSGRVLRHYLHLEPGMDLYCADITDIGILWIQEHIPNRITAFQNVTLPHLPMEDNSLDVITAFSVFTHIDRMEDFWLMELKRVLRPGGMAYLTFHSERMWHLMRPGHFLFDYLRSVPDAGGDAVAAESLFEQPMPRPRVSFRVGNGKANTGVVFHSDADIRKRWGRLFDLHAIVQCGHLFQDVAILQKRSR